MRKAVLLYIGIALVLVILFLHRKHEPEEHPQNVLLITIDTLRADHLGCYGYGEAQTPNIDRWAEKGALFLNDSASVPLTLPSHSTIMTGAYPFAHGVRDNGGFYLDEKWTTLAETLRSSGLNTGGFVSAFVLDHRWGIAQGFDEYFDHFELSKYKMVSLDSVQRKGEETLEHALGWIDQKKASRFFAWIHFYDPHTPYDPPEPFRSEFKNRGIVGLYDGEIAYVDNLIGRIHDYLERNKLLSTTLVVLTADHGESLGEHDETGHGFFIYDATMHVPLIIWLPGNIGRKIPEQVRSIDLYPTICDAFDLKAPSSVQGTSLLPLVHGNPLREKLNAYAESYYPKFHYGWSELKSLRTPDYKYVDAPQRELYRLSGDPREKENLYPIDRKKAAPFEVEMAKLLQNLTPLIAPRAIDNDSLEKLQALGYVGSYIASPPVEGKEPLADPKEKIHLYNLTKLAQCNSAEGKTKEAMDSIQQVLKEDPRILEALLVLGNLYMKEKKYTDARASFQNALNVNPDYASAVFALAKTYEEEANWEAAKAGFERLTQLDPRDSKAFFHLGDIAMAQKKFDEALSYFENVIKLDPQQASSHNRLGACYLEMKEYEKSAVEFHEALELNPRIPNAHFNTALIHEAQEHWNEAIAEYRKELDLYPEAYPAHFNLSRVYRRRGNVQQEKEELSACIREKADFGIAYLYLAKSVMDSEGDLKQARTLAEKGITVTLEKNQLPFGHYLLADIYNRLGQPREAIAQIEQARALEKR